MFSPRLIILLAAIIVLFTCCRKYNLKDDECTDFKEGIKAYDKERVVKAVEHLLIEHSNKNLDKFASALSSECNVDAKVICYSCIDTYPAQSEITVLFTDSSGPVRRVLDLSYNTINKMTIVAIHDY